MDVRNPRTRSRAGWPALLVACLVLTGLVVSSPAGVQGRSVAQALTCPSGFVHVADLEAAEARGQGVEGLALASLAGKVSPNLCVNQKHPESSGELMAAFIQNANETLAPTGRVKSGAPRSAANQRDAIKARGTTNPAWNHRWVPVGKGPLHADDPNYGTSALGNGRVAGRITDFEYVAETKTLYASVAEGGVWKSKNEGESWTSIGESLPTQVVGSIAWTPANGGTLIVISGDNSFGRYSYEGFGAYWSTNDGKRWHHSVGIPDEAFGFKVVVDPTNPKEIYVATGTGLFRSVDAGKHFVNTKLPTGACAGKSNRSAGCLLANIVTDVVVEYPGGITEEAGGTVVAAVGWRSGNKANPDGSIQSPGNGIYISASGSPGSFEKSGQTGFAPQDNIGRIEMGVAYGPEQDHNYLYALVQDAVLLNTDLPALEFPDVSPVGSTPQIATVLNGIYVSPDFGQTWTLMANGMELQEPQTGSALVVVTPALASYGPGVQAWYNMWIQPDPTVAFPGTGAPTRLTFGLEEVWENEAPVPQVGKSQFKVIGRYFSGNSCLFLTILYDDTGVPVCPTDRGDELDASTTPHPDQHQGIYIPQPDGGVRLVVGNDGGAYRQTLASGEDFNNTKWGDGQNNGFNTLLPYHAVLSGDGTVWMGLQDNGTVKITPEGRQIMAQGGDGHFVAVDPNDSKIAFGETPYANMSATTDGGITWNGLSAPVTNSQFSNQFVMDPTDPRHIVTAGRQVVETVSGAGTGADSWAKVFDLGTHDHPGDANATATGDYDEDPANSMTGMDAYKGAVYVGFCGACHALDAKEHFKNGFATNVGGKKPPLVRSPQGWHLAKAIGLPNRWISAVAIDPQNVRTVFVTLGGYSARWTPPGSLYPGGKVGKGHVYMSTDAGDHFRDITGDLPDIRAQFIELRDDELIVASDVGIFIKKRSQTNWSYLGKGLPNVQVMTAEVSPKDKNLMVIATMGRGAWTYRFGPPRPYGYKPPKPNPPPGKIKGKVLAGPFGFETGVEGWTESHVGNNMWRRQPPGHASSQSFAVLPYADQSEASLLSPKFDHPGGTMQLEWYEVQDTETCCDFLGVDWSSNGVDWYPVTSNAGQNPDFPDFSLHVAKLWAPKGPVYIRFKLTSDQLVSFPANQGVALDDILIKI